MDFAPNFSIRFEPVLALDRPAIFVSLRAALGRMTPKNRLQRFMLAEIGVWEPEFV